MSKRLDRLKLNIPEPCSERWDAMTPSGTGRHCAHCDKHVHDLARLTQREIERLILSSDGYLCARVVRGADGSIQARAAPAPPLAAWVAAGVLFSTGYAAAQSATPFTAVVRGKVLHAAAPNQQVQPRTVRFARNGRQMAEVQADDQGNWRTELPAGTYDVIIGGPMFGERVNDVMLHAGEQEFSPIRPRFAFGHLGLDREQETSVTVGELISTISGMNLRYAAHHPLAYIAMMKRRLMRVL